MAHTDHKESMKGKENLVQKEQEKHTWGTRKFDTSAIVENIVTYLKDNPPNYQGQANCMLELLYFTFAEYNSVETPEFKEQTDPLKEKLRALVDTEQEADDYMDIVFSLCAAYVRQGYLEGIKVGARLMMELMEDLRKDSVDLERGIRGCLYDGSGREPCRISAYFF